MTKTVTQTPAPNGEWHSDPYLRVVNLFDMDATAGEFLAEDGEGGFVGAVYRMAREIERLRSDEASPAPIHQEPIGFISRQTFADLVHDNSGQFDITTPHDLMSDDLVPIFTLPGAHPSDAPPALNVRCPCTTFEQSEECPVGFPSLLCAACDGKGDAPIDRVVALAAEMMKVAEQAGELEDPFAAWETIDLIKSQHGQLRKTVEELKFALFSSDMTIKDRADQAARLILATSEGSADG